MMNKILHILTLSGFLILSIDSYAQDVMQIHSGGNFYNTGDVGAFGDVVHQGDLHCGGFNFYGSTWTNSPSATIVVVGSGPGAVVFEQPNPLYGSFALQNLDGGGSTPTFHRIGINNPNNVQLINTDTYIASRLGFFTNGHLVLNNQDLVLKSAANIIGASATQHVKTNAAMTATKGFLVKEGVGASNVFYPVGNTTYNPANINNTGVVDDIKVRINDEVLGDGTSGLPYFTDRVERTWHIEEGTAGGSNVTMTLQWDETEELLGFDRTNCAVKHYTTAWDNPPTSPANNVAGTTWSQTRTGVVSFSPFGVRDPDAGILPIELVYFAVKLQEDCNGSLITWTTASEENVAQFELQHSLDGIHFVTIGKENPTNTLQTHTYYHSFYNLNLSGDATNYFRLKSIDKDASFAYSDIVHLDATACLTGSKNKYDYSIYPSPNSIGELYIRLPQGFEENKEGVFLVTDVLGRKVLEQVQNLNKGQRIFSLNIQNLAAGTYFIQHGNEQEQNLSTQKFVVIHP